LDKATSHAKICRIPKISFQNKSWINGLLNCSTCGWTVHVKKGNPQQHQLSLNEAILTGAYVGGVGYTAVKSIFSSMEIQLIHADTFRKAEDSIGERF
jgi:hypothetical protein